MKYEKLRKTQFEINYKNTEDMESQKKTQKADICKTTP